MPAVILYALIIIGATTTGTWIGHKLGTIILYLMKDTTRNAERVETIINATRKE